MRSFPPPGAPDPGATESVVQAPPDPSAARTILDGRYRVERVIGEGAFGRVYLAFDTRLRNYVAIKELLASRNATDPGLYARYVERFEREARAVFALQHPNVVTVYEMHDDSAGNHYLVMEYVDGPSLGALLAQVGALPVERAVAIATDLARALVAIAERGIVHRDFKPANIMLSSRGAAKLADFGVALIPSETIARPLGVAHPGAPAYMSPEQATGSGPVDERSDLFALGLVFYEMLTGRRYSEVRQPIQMLRQDLPQSIVGIVTKLMEPNAAWRYQHASDVVRDLELLTAAPVVPPPLPPQPVLQPTRPPQPPRWRVPVFSAAGVAVALVVVLILTQVWPRPTPPIPTATPAATVAPTATAASASATASATSAATAVLPTAITPATRAPATATPAAPTSTPLPVPTNTPVRPTLVPTTPPVSREPLGVAPAGWRTYRGNARAPFAVYYPPNWTVDESNLAKDGSVEFKNPAGDAFISIWGNTTRSTTSIDTLRDGQAKTLAASCVRSGVEVTEQIKLSGGIIFDELVESCDLAQQGELSVWLVGAGSNNSYPWYFDAASYRKNYSNKTCSCTSGNLDNYFAPILYSLHIYGNPVG